MRIPLDEAERLVAREDASGGLLRRLAGAHIRELWMNGLLVLITFALAGWIFVAMLRPFSRPAAHAPWVVPYTVVLPPVTNPF